MDTAAAIRDATRGDVEAILSLALTTGMFGADELGIFDEVFAGAFDGSMPDHHVLVAETTGVVGAAYYAPEPHGDRVWNLYFLAVGPEQQGQGIGARLVEHVETALRREGERVARVLIVETSSTGQYEATRAFYRARGFVEEARIREFYGPGDDKVVFWRSLLSA